MRLSSNSSGLGLSLLASSGGLSTWFTHVTQQSLAFLEKLFVVRKFFNAALSFQ